MPDLNKDRFKNTPSGDSILAVATSFLSFSFIFSFSHPLFLLYLHSPSLSVPLITLTFPFPCAPLPLHGPFLIPSFHSQTKHSTCSAPAGPSASFNAAIKWIRRQTWSGRHTHSTTVSHCHTHPYTCTKRPSTPVLKKRKQANIVNLKISHLISDTFIGLIHPPHPRCAAQNRVL